MERCVLFGWYVIGYLFLAGAGSGSFFVSAVCCLRDGVRATRDTEQLAYAVQPGFYAAPILLVTASLFLLLDVGNPDRIGQIAFMPLQSTMSVGAWLVALLAALSGALAVLAIALPAVPRPLLRLGCIAGSALAVGAFSYTGLLLSSMVSIDFWHTPWLTVLFGASSITTGMAVIIGANAVARPPSWHVPASLWRVAGGATAVEAIVLVVFLATQSTGSEQALESCVRLLAGDLAPIFWCGLCAAGLALPLALHGVTRRRVLQAPVPVVASLGVLVGGVALRYCVVAAALYTPLSLASTTLV